MSTFGDRIRELRKKKGLSIQELAALVKVSENTILRWEKGKVTPRSRTVLEKLSEILEVNPEWLLTGEGEMFLSHTEKVKVFEVNEPGAVYGDETHDHARRLKHLLDEVVLRSKLDLKEIPILHGLVGAGGSRYLVEPEIMGTIYLPKMMTVTWNDPFIIKVDTDQDSMAPTIPPGSYIIVSRRIYAIRKDKIYLVRDPMDPDALMIKRVEMLEDGSLKLLSDNPAYKPIIIEEWEDAPAVNMIIGQVVGVLFP